MASCLVDFSYLVLTSRFKYNIDYVISNWYGMNTTRHSILEETAKLIPFTFTIKLPLPQYKRRIVARNKQTGQIIRSVPITQ